MAVNPLIIFAKPLASKPNDISTTGPIPARIAVKYVINCFVPSLKSLNLFNIFEKNSTTVSGAYDKMIAQLGHKTVQAKEDAAASHIIFEKLKAQKEAFSGVSLDEEAANLLKYQHLFNASSKIITTANEMFQTILDLKR